LWIILIWRSIGKITRNGGKRRIGISKRFVVRSGGSRLGISIRNGWRRRGGNDYWKRKCTLRMIIIKLLCFIISLIHVNFFM